MVLAVQLYRGAYAGSIEISSGVCICRLGSVALSAEYACNRTMKQDQR